MNVLHVMSLCIVCLVLPRQARTKSGRAGGHRKVPPSSKHRLEGCSCLCIWSLLHGFIEVSLNGHNFSFILITNFS
jgi:hypothetical protein